MNGNDSSTSHGCRTPTKKLKRPPNYGGYDEEHSDGMNKFLVILFLFFSL